MGTMTATQIAGLFPASSMLLKKPDSIWIDGADPMSLPEHNDPVVTGRSRAMTILKSVGLFAAGVAATLAVGLLMRWSTHRQAPTDTASVATDWSTNIG